VPGAGGFRWGKRVNDKKKSIISQIDDYITQYVTNIELCNG
jgi:hypothetical protein